jgi:predicted  nucleic acid-binding Zn-ribbon protein
MSLLAKVFVVIQLVLITTYLGVTATLYQHRKDWRNSYQKLKDRYKVSTQLSSKEIDALRSGIKAKNDFISLKQQEVIDLKKELDRQNLALADTKGLLNAKNKDFLDMSRKFDEASTAERQRQTELGQQRTRNDELQANLDTATRRREIAEGQVARLVQYKTSLEKDISDVRQNYADTRKSLKEKELVLAMLEERGVNVTSIVAGPPVPAIDAKVAAVKADVNPALVLLSVGSDDKVEKGFHFSVYRGAEFVGKVVVEKVLKDSCGCRVLFTKDGATIQAGDSAATRLQ